MDKSKSDIDMTWALRWAVAVLFVLFIGLICGYQIKECPKFHADSQAKAEESKVRVQIKWVEIDKIVEVPVEKIVEVEKIIEKEKIVTKNVYKDKIVYKDREVLVPFPVEVEVEKVVTEYIYLLPCQRRVR